MRTLRGDKKHRVGWEPSHLHDGVGLHQPRCNVPLPLVITLGDLADISKGQAEFRAVIDTEAMWNCKVQAVRASRLMWMCRT